MSNTLRRKYTATTMVLLATIAVAVVVAFSGGGNHLAQAKNATGLADFDFKLEALTCGQTGQGSCTQATLSVINIASNRGKSDSLVTANDNISTSNVAVTYKEAGVLKGAGGTFSYNGVGTGTLYSTIQQLNSANQTTNTIVEDSNKLIIEVDDPDSLTLTTVTGTHEVANTDLSTFIIATDTLLPIADENNNGTLRDDVKITLPSGSTDVVTILAVAAGGNGTNGVVNFGCTVSLGGAASNCNGDTGASAGPGGNVTISWPTSDGDSSVIVEVRSSRTTDPIFVALNESVRGTGKFTGVVEIVDGDNATQADAVENQKTAGAVPAVTGATCNQNDASVNACADVNGTTTITKVAAVNGSDVTISYRDKTGTEASANTPTTALLSVPVSVETAAPSITVNTPVDNTFSTSGTPEFKGTAADTGGSGLDVSTLHLEIDDRDDPNNTMNILSAFNTVSATVPTVSASDLSAKGNAATQDGIKLVASGSDRFSDTSERDHFIFGDTDPNYTDGISSLSWEYTVRSSDELLGGITNVDHAVDYGLYVADIAGNVAITDANTASTAPGFQGFVFNIDKTNPAIIATDASTTAALAPWNQGTPLVPATNVSVNGNSRTGVTWNSANNVFEVNRRVIMVVFNDIVKDVESTDFNVVFGSGFANPTVERVFTASAPDLTNAAIFSTISETGQRADLASLVARSVFVELNMDIPSNIRPVVTVNGVTDEAGNAIQANSTVNAQDGLGPKVTVQVVSTTDQTPITLTSGNARILITADEGTGRPDVTYHRGSTQEMLQANSSGDREWRSDADAATVSNNNGLVCVEVTVRDATNNSTTVGTPDCANETGDKKISYTLDTAAPSVTLNGVAPNGVVTVDTSRPLLRARFTDVNNVDIVQFEVDDIDRIGELDGNTTGSTDYSFLLDGEFAFKDFKVEIQGKDLAGNTSSVSEFTLRVTERAKFAFNINAGWNAVSFPSDPVDKSVTSVFASSRITRVLSYDASQFRNPWSVATRNNANFVGGLQTIDSGKGYWVFSTGFVNQSIDLEGPIAPTNPDLQIIPATIPAGIGWNFVGVVDPTRQNTTGSAATLPNVTVESYLDSVNQSRVYRWDATAGAFVAIGSGTAAGSTVNTGEGIWVYINPNNNGSQPVIIP